MQAWGFEKALSKRKAIPMIQKQDQRQANGKRTEWKFHGQPVSEEKLERWRKRFENELVESVQSPVPCTFPTLLDSKLKANPRP
jgi:hypothetical protein